MRVLLVEDDQNCADVIHNSLGKLCNSITQTGKLKEAMAAMALLGDHFDGIWLDLQLTDSDVQATLASIPEIRRRCPGATLIVVSGYGELYRDQSLKAGADAYATKTELSGFSTPALAALLSHAATKALQRGVDVTAVLIYVTSFLAASFADAEQRKPRFS